MIDTNQEPNEVRRFGTYLRRLRESRKLSLDAVEELAAGYPERITKSHLSRIENGQAEVGAQPDAILTITGDGAHTATIKAFSAVIGIPVTAVKNA